MEWFTADVCVPAWAVLIGMCGFGTLVAFIYDLFNTVPPFGPFK